MSNNVPASRARDYLAEVHDGLDTSWGVPGGKVERFEAFRALGDEAKTAWLAWIVATSLEAKEMYGSHAQNPLQNRLATILEIDVASWWRPTSENFFDRVSKGSLISLLHEVGGPALSSRHATEKKPTFLPPARSSSLARRSSSPRSRRRRCSGCRARCGSTMSRPRPGIWTTSRAISPT
jgi:ParB family chromosome partitioning protein